jgi:hypothetical protein
VSLYTCVDAWNTQRFSPQANGTILAFQTVCVAARAGSPPEDPLLLDLRFCNASVPAASFRAVPADAAWRETDAAQPGTVTSPYCWRGQIFEALSFRGGAPPESALSEAGRAALTPSLLAKYRVWCPPLVSGNAGTNVIVDGTTATSCAKGAPFGGACKLACAPGFSPLYGARPAFRRARRRPRPPSQYALPLSRASDRGTRPRRRARRRRPRYRQQPRAAAAADAAHPLRAHQRRDAAAALNLKRARHWYFEVLPNLLNEDNVSTTLLIIRRLICFTPPLI